MYTCHKLVFANERHVGDMEKHLPQLLLKYSLFRVGCFLSGTCLEVGLGFSGSATSVCADLGIMKQKQNKQLETTSMFSRNSVRTLTPVHFICLYAMHKLEWIALKVVEIGLLQSSKGHLIVFLKLNN